MDNRAFISRLAKNMDMESRETSRLVQSLVEIIGERLAAGENVALPGFGTFESHKSVEYVSTDTATGEKILMPPVIKASFTIGSRVKKSISRL